MWPLAECTVHVEMSSDRGVGGWMKETGKRKCQVLRCQDRFEKRRICFDQAACVDTSICYFVGFWLWNSVFICLLDIQPSRPDFPQNLFSIMLDLAKQSL